MMRSARGVRVRPGATQLTRTPFGAYVAAADSIKPGGTQVGGHINADSTRGVIRLSAPAIWLQALKLTNVLETGVRTAVVNLLVMTAKRNACTRPAGR
jgi:hypothetical protein